MLDSFRKRDNVRPTTSPQPGVRPAAPNLAHAPNNSPLNASPRVEPAAPVKPILLDAAPGSVVAEPPTPEESIAQSNPSQPSTARLIVGPDIKLKGAEITDCDTLIVEGQVDASMDSRVVEIAESGVFRGKVQVEEAEIRGRFEGDLTARKHLVIRETGRVSGTIRYGKIRIDEGGVVSGDVAATDPAAGEVQRNLSQRAREVVAK